MHLEILKLLKLLFRAETNGRILQLDPVEGIHLTKGAKIALD